MRALWSTAPGKAVLSLAVILVMVISGSLAALASPHGDHDNGAMSRAGLKKWTFIIYLFSDSSQHGGVLESYYDMVPNLETKGGWSDENINVLVLQDRHAKFAPDKDGNTYAYYVKEGKGNSERIGLGEIDPSWVNEVDMGDRHTVISFGTYAIQHFPAEHYAVVTRSAGWWPDNFGEDENDGKGVFDNTNVHEFRSALAALSRVAGKRLDVLTIAGCTSGLFEWAYDFHPYVDYYVGSETYSIGSYWRIFYWIDALRKDIGMTPENFTKVIVNEYLNENRTGYNPFNSITASSTNMQRLKAVANAIDNMSLALMANMRSNINEIWIGRSKTVEIDNYLRVDAYEIAMQIRNRFPAGSAVNKTASEVMDSVKDMTVLGRSRTAKDNAGINVSTARGLSLYFVRDRQVHMDNAVEGYRSRLHMSLENHWLAFLDEFFSYYHTNEDFVVGDLKINVVSGSGDADADGWSDDIGVSVWYGIDTPVKDAKIYLNGKFVGLTDRHGWLVAYNFLPGTYMVTAVYDEATASTVVYTPGYGPGFHLFLDLVPGDWDNDGSADDVQVHVRDNDWNGIGWAQIYSDLGWLGYTDEKGYLHSFNYRQGYHYVYALVWNTYWAINGFYSEGGEADDISADVRVIDYMNDGKVNDLDIFVENRAGDLVTGAIVYIDGNYLGETSEGRIMMQNEKERIHQVDVYYKYEKNLKDAFFREVRARLVDLDGDGMEETGSVQYDVDLQLPAMDVKVTVQVIEWSTGDQEGLYRDNFTAVKGREDFRYINHTTDHTGYVNLVLTLMDVDNFIKDQWTITGLWLETTPNRQPVANLFVRPTYASVGDAVTFNATNSYDEDGNVTGYLFDFGDGTNSSWTNKTVATHVYSRPGNFTVNLMVMDDRGAIDNKSNQITLWIKPLPSNLFPKARLFARPTYVYPWEEVSFNGSTSEDQDGEVVQYQFNFGDGTTTGWMNTSMAVHIYNTPGNFSAKLKVKDNLGGVSDWSSMVTVWVKDRSGNEAPTAYLERRPTTAKVNETVTFNASGSSDPDGSVYRYFFDFGDGTGSGWTYDPVATHSYDEPGYFTTKVKVEDDQEAVSDWSKPRGVDVLGNELPSPYLFSRPHYVAVGQEVTFNASASVDKDGHVVQFFFDFGDGTISGWTRQSVMTHTYDVPGNYTVNLWVRDDKGDVSKGSSRTTITVGEVATTGELSSRATSIAVLILFVILIIAGTIYEVKRSRLKGAGYGVGPPVKDEEKKAAEGEEDGKVGRDEPKGDIEKDEGATEDGTAEKDIPVLKVDPETRPSPVPPRTEAKPQTKGSFRVKCRGCGAHIEVPKGPRPIQVMCHSCGKTGVLR